MRARVLAVLVFSVLLLALTTGSAAASSIATTEPATNIRVTSALLVGVVNTPQFGASWLFEYGKTRTLGSLTRPVPIFFPFGPTAVSTKVGGLKPDTKYYFRLVVIEGNYTTHQDFGAILSFRTK